VKAARWRLTTSGQRRGSPSCAITGGFPITAMTPTATTQRLDTLQAAVLRAKLEHLEAWNRRRRELAARYRELLSNSAVQLPAQPEGLLSCYHLFTIQRPRREAIRAALTGAGIGNGIHYPLPLHLQPACAGLGYQVGDFPVSERIADTTLSLPMHPHLSDSEVDTVAAVVRRALGEL
jgi:dTDP-4-amino-4,6-dideoxygalactose transaminase